MTDEIIFFLSKKPPLSKVQLWKKYYLWRIFYRNKYKFPLLFWILLLDQIKNFLRNLMYSVSSKNLHLLKIILWYYPSIWRLPWETMVSESFCIYYRNIIKDIPTIIPVFLCIKSVGKSSPPTNIHITGLSVRHICFFSFWGADIVK